MARPTLEFLAIPYDNNQPADLDLWDSIFSSTSLIGVKKFIININRHLKKANSNTITDFIYLENDRVIITTSQATFAQDISIIEKYVKETNNIDFKHIDIP